MTKTFEKENGRLKVTETREPDVKQYNLRDIRANIRGLEAQLAEQKELEAEAVKLGLKEEDSPI